MHHTAISWFLKTVYKFVKFTTIFVAHCHVCDLKIYRHKFTWIWQKKQFRCLSYSTRKEEFLLLNYYINKLNNILNVIIIHIEIILTLFRFKVLPRSKNQMIKKCRCELENSDDANGRRLHQGWLKKLYTLIWTLFVMIKAPSSKNLGIILPP